MRGTDTIGGKNWESPVHGRFHRFSFGHRRHHVDAALRHFLRAHLMLDFVLGGGVSAFLLIYLVWALIRPEDF
jgi:K+-transporting ATPase KdpF subunit